MNIREISDVFKDTANQITAIKSYNFGWPSDRTRSTNTEDYQELNEFPRVFFSVPTIIGSDQTRKQDTYQVTLFFDDLLGYNNEGDADLTLQLDKWAALQEYANYFVQRLNKVKQTILPNYLFIPEAPSITFDSFTGLQRMITVQLSFTLVVPTNCEPIVSKLVECIANIVTSSNLTAALKNLIDLTSSLQASSSLSANLQLTKFAASSLNANATLNASALVSKLAASSLTGAGILAADLTVTALVPLLLDLYPNAAAAYSLRKLRTDYTGSAIRVRRSSDNTEQDIGFVSGNLDTVALLVFCGVGNGFVTTWYDQSGNARNATQTTAANQPRIVNSGVVDLDNSKPSLLFNGSSQFFNTGNKLLANNTSLIAAFNFTRENAVGAIVGQWQSGISGRMAFTSNQNIIGSESPNFLNFFNSSEIGTQNIVAPANMNLIFWNIQTGTGNYKVFNNGQNKYNATITTIATTINTAIGIMGEPALLNYYDGKISEIIIYNSIQTNRTQIESNLNTHYAIY